MSQAVKRYNRSEKAKSDKAQSVFGPTGEIKCIRKDIITKNNLDVTKRTFCPFCLKSAKISNFLVSGKKGISKSKAKCKFCGVTMRLKTVLRKWTARQYADWVYDYSKSGFWQKIDFEKWKTGLGLKKGWLSIFWDRYKQLKERSEETTAQDVEAGELYDDIASKEGW